MVGLYSGRTCQQSRQGTAGHTVLTTSLRRTSNSINCGGSTPTPQSRLCSRKAAQQLTSDSTLSIKSFAISPQSDRIAFSAGHNPLLAFIKDEDIYLLDLPRAGSSPGAVSKIVALPDSDGSPMFSLDGKQLAFVTSLGQPNFFYADSHIALVDLATVLKKPAVSASDVRDLTQFR